MGTISNRDDRTEQANEAVVEEHKRQIASGRAKPGTHQGRSPRDVNKDNQPDASFGGNVHAADQMGGRTWVGEEREREGQRRDHEMVGQTSRMRTHEETQDTTLGNISSQDVGRVGAGRDRRTNEKK